MHQTGGDQHRHQVQRGDPGADPKAHHVDAELVMDEAQRVQSLLAPTSPGVTDPDLHHRAAGPGVPTRGPHSGPLQILRHQVELEVSERAIAHRERRCEIGQRG